MTRLSIYTIIICDWTIPSLVITSKVTDLKSEVGKLDILTSEQLVTSCGVPQGSTLGPIKLYSV